jgi:cellulose synthase/poly-beta-1,6-N-acetylglucosamine synthase-like glycosyltransferase
VSAVLVAVGWLWIFVVSTLVVLLLVEVLAGWRFRSAPPPSGLPPPPYVVLMPAHNEAGAITATVEAVRKQLSAAARLLVVADNCCDGTAAEARAAGAEVIERTNPVLRGKGYALAFGVDHLRHSPPEVVLVLDADCIPAPGALELLAAQAFRLQRPIQALYLMLARPGSPLRVRMGAFAWTLRNQVRPLGLHRLGLPVQLMGSGMAFPWSCMETVDFASGHLAEDLQLGLKLAEAGQAPRFCPQACVESWFPESQGGLDSQRKRWEHGHLSMIVSAVPGTLWRGLRSGHAGPVALALDVCIPPLALLSVLVALSCAFGAWLAGMGQAGQVAAASALVSAFAFAGTVLLAWWSAGRRWVSFSELVLAPLYVIRKLPVYASFVLKRQKEWVRTSRHR